MFDGSGRSISAAVTQAILNAHRDDPEAVFVHRPSFRPARATVYARIDRDPPFTFLTYNAVFRVSGLPAGMPWWQEAALSAVASLDDWHQLDHYTAATVALDRAQTPVAVTLQQHNGMRTYLLGRDMPLPPDGRVEIDVAIRSNELYPHRAEVTRWRAVSLPTVPALRYLLTGENRPWRAADDITHGAQEAEYRLAFLPPADAFYSFQGYLGERRVLPGRDGPPGADYNTVPSLKSKRLSMLAGFLRDGDPGDLARLDAAAARGTGHFDGAFALGQEPAFAAALACLAARRVLC